MDSIALVMRHRRWSMLAVIVATWLVGLVGATAPVGGATGRETPSSPRVATGVALADPQPATFRTASESTVDRSGQQSSKKTPFLLLAVLAVTLGLVPLRHGYQRGPGRRSSSSPWRRQLVALRAPPALQFT